MSLRLTFSELYTSVHNYAVAPGTPTGDDLTKAKEIVYRAYRQFLYPVSTLTKKAHLWSWLVKEGTLTLRSGQDTYALPEDYESIQRPFVYTADAGRYGRLVKTSMGRIMTEKSWNSWSGGPIYFAVFPETVDTGVDQGKQVIVWPTPDGTYDMNYSYVCVPKKPVNDTDVCMGNANTDEVLLQVCLAVAEQQLDEKIDLQTKLAEQRLQSLILRDSVDAPSTVGHVVDSNIHRPVGIQEYILRNTTLNVETE